MLRQLLLVSLAVSAARGQATELDLSPPDFSRDIRPLLSDRCFTCHAGDEARALRLDRREDAVDDLGGAAIVPGDSAGSTLMQRIAHADPERRMPPTKSKLELNEAEIDLLRRWIDAGAPYETHWAYLRPERTAPPDVRRADWARDPLDGFVLGELERVDLAPAPEADDATLMRRAHLDLTGLPPTVDELAAFLAARADDPSDRPYERAVDALLASPAHAEHMASAWLDVARYADTFGYQSDVDMNVWPWRDWLLRAFEQNLPYDQFLTWQLAGDLVSDGDGGALFDARLATTFQRLHRQTNEGGSVEEEFRVQYVCDRVETTAAAFMGVTIGCARCHDHKFDPITQRDYFGLFALFDGIDESGLYSHFTNAVPTPALDLPTAEQVVKLTELDARVRAAEARYDAVEAQVTASGAVRCYAGPAAWFHFDRPPGESDVGQPYTTLDDPTPIDGVRGGGYRLSGEDGLTFPNVGVLERSDPFSIGLCLRAPRRYERAVVLHRTKSWTDSGSRGYQLLIEDGHLSVALVHFWPGDAIAIRAKEPLKLDTWQSVLFTYDGSSRAAGLTLYVDGARAETEVVRDHLTRTIQGGGIEHLTIGSRFRDNGFKDGEVDELVVYDRELDAAWGASGVGLFLQAPTGAPDAALEAATLALQALRRERDALRDRVRQIMTMREAPTGLQRTAYLLNRGSYDARRAPVAPATPAALPRLLDAPVRTRLDLARWLVHPDHPLTARVHVDRLWRAAFGQRLLPAPEDLGYQSPAPLHRALLDTLARDLVESGWDSRALLRRMVLSATYRQSSRASQAARERDPNNARFSRAASHRLPAEVLRDGALCAAGLLAPERGGPPVMPYQPVGLWEEKSGKVYTPGRGDALRRRSLYTFWRRTSPPPTLAILGAPSREVCTVRRERTESPLQTLALWNDPQFVEAAVHLARRAVERGRADDGARVEHLFLALASRPPTDTERAAALALLAAQRADFRARPADAVALARYDLERVAHPADAPNSGSDAASGDGLPHGADSTSGGTKAPLDEATLEVASTAVLASALLSLDDVVTRR